MDYDFKPIGGNGIKRTILQKLELLNALFYKKWSFKTHYFTKIGVLKRTILQDLEH